MDVRNSRGRVFSILNDNDSPSFVIRHNNTQPPPLPATKLQSALEPRQERPSFLRSAQYSKRQSSFSSIGSGSAGSPPLFRHDSSSSKSSSGSMESSPSPITPAYTYNDSTYLPYGDMLRQDFLPSPTSITPFMEQQMMIAPSMPGDLSQFSAKSMGGLPPIAPSQYPLLPAAPLEHQQQTLTPAPSLQSVSNSRSTPSKSTKPSPQNATTSSTGKKNKYPCPYAASHNCSATFTTSGHAARHGKKHTGEKGVHCPICDKAFTRKDNMKQHERTHKGSASGSTSDEQPVGRSKAAITKEAQKIKSEQSENQISNLARKTSLITSPLSEVTPLAPSAIETPLTLEEPVLYQNPVPQNMIPTEPSVSASMSMYPPLGDDTMLNTNPIMLQPLQFDPTKQNLLPELAAPPPLMRGFSDLDTLAQAAAESYEPYYQQRYTGS
jgi:Zinc finger, C2H2 type